MCVCKASGTRTHNCHKRIYVRVCVRTYIPVPTYIRSIDWIVKENSCSSAFPIYRY